MKITVLTYAEHENEEKFDEVVEQVAIALRDLGHQVSVLGVHADLRKLYVHLLRKKPDLVFNLMEEFDQNMQGDVGIAGLLDLISMPHTGGGAGEYYLQQDKGITKRMLAYDGIQYPKYVVYHPGDPLEKGAKLKFPLFVKPLRGDASLGIELKSLVQDQRELKRRVDTIHEKFNDSALAEEYIEGREFYVGVMGNRHLVALPAIEMDFSGLPPGEPRFLDRKAKFARRSLRYKGTKSVLAQIPVELQARLQKVALAAYKAVFVRDYGRVDLRLTDDGEIYVIEVNASCYLEKESEFAMAAQAAGIQYPELCKKILELACERWNVKADSSRDERGSSPAQSRES
jgi:D-alanine-D-alanine ligase